MNPIVHPTHRPRLALACALLSAALLGACGTPAPASRLHRLPTAAPVAPVAMPAAAVAAPASATSAPALPATWQLVTPVTLPQYLDRDALLTARGTGGLQPLAGERWAEPLRDAVPRVLVADLGLLRGAPVWLTPPPGGAAALVRQLRVELMSFETAADGETLQLQARWWLTGPTSASSSQPPPLQQVEIVVPIGTQAAGSGADALVAAHRLALWRLAERIAGVR